MCIKHEAAGFAGGLSLSKKTVFGQTFCNKCSKIGRGDKNAGTRKEGPRGYRNGGHSKSGAARSSIAAGGCSSRIRETVRNRGTACDKSGYVLEAVVTPGNVHDSAAFDDELILHFAACLVPSGSGRFSTS